MIKLIGIPHDENSSFMRGSSLAPKLIRQMDTDGSANPFAENGQLVKKDKTYQDLGDIDFDGDDSHQAYLKIKQVIQQQLNLNHQIICLGGDHSISFPIIEMHAKKYPRLNVLHFDAHADIYENFEDNPYSHASPFARLMETQLIAKLTQVGIRTLDSHQRQQINKYDVDVIEMKDFNFDFINKLKGPLYISIDLDGLDPAFAPGVSHHEPGGLSTREIIKCIQDIEVPIVGADIVEYNPKRDLNYMTAMVAYKLFKEIAAKILQL
jgi:agmatinase